MQYLGKSATGGSQYIVSKTVRSSRQELTRAASNLAAIRGHPEQSKVKQAEDLVDQARRLLYEIQEQDK